MSVQIPTFPVALRRVEQTLRQMRREPTPRHIHCFRTASKRLEAWLARLPDASDRTAAKAAKSLKQFRRQTGRLRDLDVHRQLLLELHLPGETSLLRRLRRELSQQRRQAQKKLEQKLASPAGDRLRRRVRRLRPLAVHAPGPQLTAAAAQREFLRLLARQPRPQVNQLHAFRKQGKRLRYVAEIDQSPAGQRTTAALRRLHAAIGRWHDWAELAEYAAAWPPAQTVPRLGAALNGITQTQLHRALQLTEEVRREFSAPMLPTRRPPHGVKAAGAERISA